jgi:aromatic ring-opening dioxygenase catalytic subunit (LigB family)
VDALSAYLRDVPKVAEAARALLVVSAHWEQRVPTVTTAESPPLLYDYYGFPPESYRITWPAPGDPAIAARVRALLDGAGFAAAGDPERGFDHGTFVPMKVAYPRAEVPTVQLSLLRGLDPLAHLEIGRALAPLRDEGVFVVGSGMTFHDLRAFFARGSTSVSERFDAWLRESMTRPAAERDARLVAWEQAPAARGAHPREEHLLPLMVVAGAAGEDRGAVAWAGTMMGHRLSAYHFGAA